MEVNTIITNRPHNKIAVKILSAIGIFLSTQTFLLAISAKTIKQLDLSKTSIALLESSLICIFVIIGIWMLRKTFDQGSPASIGLNNSFKAVSNFSLGFGLLLAPLIISLFISDIAGWAHIKVNWHEAQINMILLGMLSVFITDALPEELVYRGYIYSNLLKDVVKWKSAIITTILFVLTPIILFPLKNLLGSDLTTGIVNSISVSYLVYMLIFGAFAIYLRILTKSIWTGVGFHMMFVYMNQLIGLEEVNLIQFESFSKELPVQLTFMICLLITFIILFTYPKIKGFKIGWKSNKD